MKQYIYTLIACLLMTSSTLMAQEEVLTVNTPDSIPPEATDTTIIRFKKSTVYIVSELDKDSLDRDSLDMICQDDKSQLSNWAGIDIAINGYMAADGTPDLSTADEYMELDYGKSRSVSINFLEHKARIVSDYFGLLTGAGLQYNSYRFANDYTLASQGDSLIAYVDSSISLSKNKLRTTYLNVPLMLEFNTSRKHERSFHMAVGVVGGLHLGSMYKQKYSSEGQDYKVKSKNDFQVAPYKLEAMIRLGYGSFNMFAGYQLTQLFEEGHGPELYPWTAGITLVAFD